jgi:AbrB family looped-hinge helix DNA binding protein
VFVYKSVITLDKQGRIVIPAKVREAMEVREGDSLAVEYQDGILQVYVINTEK